MKRWVIVVIALSSPFAFSFDRAGFTFYFTNDFLYQKNRLANEADQFTDSFSVFGKYGRWSGGFTFRGTDFYKQRANSTLADADISLYRKYLKYDAGDLHLQAGDFHAMLGRGMVLSVLQNDKTLRERTIEGGEVLFRHGRLDFRALGGTVRSETGNQQWRAYGAETAVEYLKGNRIGARLSYIQDVRTFLHLGNRMTGSFSFAGDNLFDLFSYYAEYGRLDFRNQGVDGGEALYSNVAFHRKNVSVMVEYKKYKNFDNELNNPPVADRDDEYNDLGDTAGGRVYAQYSFFDPDIIVFANVGRYREGGATGNNVYGGFMVEDLWDKVNASFSYGVKDINYPVKKTDASFTYKFTERLSVEFTLRDKRYHMDTYKFNEQDYLTQLSRSPWGAVFFQYQYSADKVIKRHRFYYGGVRANIREGSFIEVSGGQIRGGEVCAGGQCVLLPSFKGWKVAAYITLK